ncbi:hypothetical protein NL532_31930 [Mesorhizobium sp. C120A]|uniref:hypothetical protein n=1 Tax=unclassified Mesorhizobium TaxID=325217 RepID=UPI0003D01FB2|nr:MULTISPECIES: hypothetical protein [unclassified Mesorhizobium]ESZ63740.1 hypothetical protein X728_08910 [Mesorhizobium sp. L103C120A0]WJI45053.1 hypothetical protein NL532_31930 [Mesorhizobium sp. C120A]
MTEKIPTYRPGDVVLAMGKVERSTHDSSIYVRFPSGECPQLSDVDITKVVRHAIKIGDPVSWPVDRSVVNGRRLKGQVLAVNPEPGNDIVWLWVQEDGRTRVTLNAAEVTRL